MIEPDYTPGEVLDALESLTVLTGYQLLEYRITAELERRRRELEQRSLTPGETAFCRGQISTLRTVLDLPAIMRGEAQGSVKKENNDVS